MKRITTYLREHPALIVALAVLCLAAGSNLVENAKFADIFNWTPKEIWISADRTDGKGKGTQVDPYDGSTKAKFEAILADSGKAPANATIHLGPGLFTVSKHDTVVTNLRSGWTLAGAGMYATTVQLDGTTTLAAGAGCNLFSSGYNAHTDGVTIQDMTLDSNWPNVAAGATVGASGSNAVTCKTLSGSPTITCGADGQGNVTANGGWGFTVSNFKRTVTGTGIPGSTTILRIPTTTIAAASDGFVLFAPLTSVTTTVSTDVFTKTAHGLANGTPVVPTGLSSTTGVTNGTTYYVVNTAANTFKLSATLGGSAIDLTGSNDSSVTISYPSTITVTSAADFYGDGSHGGSFYAARTKDGGLSVVTYTARTGTTFTGCSGGGGGLLQTGDTVSTLSQAVLTNNASATSGSVSLTIGNELNAAVASAIITGSNNKFLRVRSINNYGSEANGTEMFALCLNTPSGTDGGTSDGSYNNWIEDCVAELPKGNYGNPFAMFGVINKPMRGSGVINCRAIGINNGVNGGWNSGGVNVAYNKGLMVTGNTFTDCFGILYHDTGPLNEVTISNNRAIRCWGAIQSVSADGPSDNYEISGNYCEVQNRFVGGASYGFNFNSVGTHSNVRLEGNTFRKNATGFGYYEFRGFLDGGTTTNSVFRNNIFNATDVNFQTASVASNTFKGNRTLAGARISDLVDTFGVIVDTVHPVTQNIPADAAVHTITWSNNGAMQSNVFTAPAAGTYHFRGNVYMDNLGNGYLNLQLTINSGASTVGRSSGPCTSTANRVSLPVNYTATLAAGDTVEVQVYNATDSGTAHVEEAASGAYTWLQIERKE